MGTPHDPEYPPILPPGFHDFTPADLEDRFVKPFPTSSTRSDLLGRFLALCSIFKRWGTQITLWMNGSFVTEKEQPDDIDVAFLLDSTLESSLNRTQKEELQDLTRRSIETKLRYGCHFFVIDPDEMKDRVYWRGLFGFDRDDVPKGVVRLKIGSP